MTTYKDSGSRSEFETGAVRDAQAGKGRMDLLPVRAIFALARVMEVGAEKYDARNWEKGIPLSRFMDSGIRHLMKWLRGDRDEPHLDMGLWNIACAVDTQQRIAEGLLPHSLNDLPFNPIDIDLDAIAVNATEGGRPPAVEHKPEVEVEF